jgi:acyl transferase domain-containing protein
VDWHAVQAGRPRRRVPLPAYPFERERYWIEPAPAGQHRAGARSGKNPDVADWFYLPSWRRTLPGTASEGAPASGRWLLFADRSGLADRLAARLCGAGCAVLKVIPGDRFEAQPDRLTLNPAEPADYIRLVEALEAAGGVPERIAHLWGVERARAGSQDALERGFYSLVFLARALAARDPATPRELVVLSQGVQQVTGEETLWPEGATVLGPCKVIPQEYPHLTCRSVDVAAPAGDWDDAAVGELAAELVSARLDRVVAFRNGHRWVQSFERVALPAPKGRPRRLRERGVYLVSGGLGGIGLEVAGSLARCVRARLALVGRTTLPPRSEWESWLAAHARDDETSRRLLRIQELEALGAEVLVLAADVADADQMRHALREVEARFGALHGVVHAAGGERADHFVGDASREQLEAQFRPRLRGVAVLEQVLEGLPLDFCLLQSSLSSVLGAAGSVAYTAAHAFLDAFAARHNRRSAVPWLSVNWDRWFTWREAAPVSERDSPECFMSPPEAADALLRVLSAGPVSQIVVSTGDLEARIDKSIRLSFLGRSGGDGVVPGSHLPARRAQRAYPRPELAVAYVAPRTPAERILAGIWCEALGVEKVGVHDDFFELGGDSVLGLRIVAKANEAGLRMIGRQIFEHHTIAELAGAVARPVSVAADHAGGGPGEGATSFPAARLNQQQLATILTQLGGREGKPK